MRRRSTKPETAASPHRNTAAANDESVDVCYNATHTVDQPTNVFLLVARPRKLSHGNSCERAKQTFAVTRNTTKHR